MKANATLTGNAYAAPSPSAGSASEISNGRAFPFVYDGSGSNARTPLDLGATSTYLTMRT